MSEFQKPSCPECGQIEPVRYSKEDKQWYCWRKVSGCGAKWQTGARTAAATAPPPAQSPPAVNANPTPAVTSSTPVEANEHSDRDRLIMRQVALKAAVDYHAYKGGGTEASEITTTAQYFNDWLNGKTVQKPLRASYVAHIREGEDLATAARRALEEHDPLAGIELDEEPPHPVDTWEGPSNRTPVRETLRAGAPRREKLRSPSRMHG